MWIEPGTAGYAQWRIAPTVKAGVSTRQGGVSAPPFESLNVSFNVGDDREAVLINRGRVARGFNQLPETMVWAEQVHGADVAVVCSEPVASGQSRSVPAVDGLLTQDPNLLLSLAFADCVPIFLASPEHGWIGVVHAGWRGTAGNVAVRAVLELSKQGVPVHDLWAGIGPSIGPCCYEVDDPVIERLASAMGSSDGPGWIPNGRPDHYQLDLWEVNRQLLLRAGVLREHIETAAVCTACHPEWFFSHRGEQGRTGRFGAFICRL